MTSPARRPWIDALLLVALGAALSAWTWRGWGDPRIDFGRELYTPWRLLEGDVLHRDIPWFNGPLSQYFNAACFGILGTSYRTLILVNHALVALAGWLLWGLVRGMSSRACAFVAVASWLLLCCFLQLDIIGNSNWIAPYSHEITHGSLAAFAALRAWQVHLAGRRAWPLLVAGLASGLAFLTKPEVLFALAAAGLAAIYLRAQKKRWQPVEVAVLAGGFAAPILGALALLWTSMPLDKALHATLGGWAHVLNSELTNQIFYTRSQGTHDPLASLSTLAIVASLWASLVALGLVLARASKSRRLAWIGGVVAFGLVIATSWDLEARESVTGLFERAGRLFDEGMSPLPLAVALALLWRWRRTRDKGHEAEQDESHARHAGAFVFEVFALVLLSKIVLHARIKHYGFALAAPALVVVIVHGFYEIPRRLNTRSLGGAAVRATLVGALLGLCLIALRHNYGYETRKKHLVGEGADQMRCDHSGLLLADLVSIVERRSTRDSSLLVLPEGIQLNYLTRRKNPTGIVNFMPPEYLMFGEDAILERLQANPPDAIVINHRKTSEYGLPFFGRDYGRETMRWVLDRYASPAAAWARRGKEPLQPETGNLLAAWFFFPKKR